MPCLEVSVLSTGFSKNFLLLNNWDNDFKILAYWKLLFDLALIVYSTGSTTLKFSSKYLNLLYTLLKGPSTPNTYRSWFTSSFTKSVITDAASLQLHFSKVCLIIFLESWADTTDELNSKSATNSSTQFTDSWKRLSNLRSNKPSFFPAAFCQGSLSLSIPRDCFQWYLLHQLHYGQLYNHLRFSAELQI